MPVEKYHDVDHVNAHHHFIFQHTGEPLLRALVLKKRGLTLPTPSAIPPNQAVW